MPRRSNEAYWGDIATAAQHARRMAEGVTREGYLGDIEKRSAIERQLMIVGEAAYQLRNRRDPKLAGLSYADEIVAFRHILVHAYSGVDSVVVWDIVQSHLPRVLNELAALGIYPSPSPPLAE